MAIKTRGAASSSVIKVGSSEGEWEDAENIELDRECVFMDIFGDTSTGRTRLALTAPGPIAYAHAAEKMEGVIKEAKERDPRIKIHNFGGTFSGGNQEVATQAQAKWDKLSRLLGDAITGGWTRTTIEDTATEGWELCRYSHFGTLKPEGRVDNLYTAVNADWRKVFKRFRSQNTTNLITIHQVKDEYIERIQGGKKLSARTGRQVRAGMKEMAYLADVVIRTGRDDDGQFTATIVKGWFNAFSEGTVFTGDEVTFATIMEFIDSSAPEGRWRK